MAMSLTWSSLVVEEAELMQFKDRMKYDRVQAWSPNPAPVKQEDLPGYLYNELDSLANAIWKDDRTTVPVMPKLPERPREGDMIVMDNGLGVNQLKVYLNGVWVVIA
jgi:hypothetical protein